MNQFLEDEPLDEDQDFSKRAMDMVSPNKPEEFLAIRPAPPTKRKKSPAIAKNPKPQKSQSKPVAQRIMAEKKALAKAQPKQPTFAPEINQKSKKLAR